MDFGGKFFFVAFWTINVSTVVVFYLSPLAFDIFLTARKYFVFFRGFRLLDSTPPDGGEWMIECLYAFAHTGAAV